MEMLKRLEPVALLLVICGALNWGILGITDGDTNVLSSIFGSGTLLNVVYVIVGVSALVFVPRLMEALHIRGPHPRGVYGGGDGAAGAGGAAAANQVRRLRRPTCIRREPGQLARLPACYVAMRAGAHERDRALHPRSRRHRRHHAAGTGGGWRGGRRRGAGVGVRPRLDGRDHDDG